RPFGIIADIFIQHTVVSQPFSNGVIFRQAGVKNGNPWFSREGRLSRKRAADGRATSLGGREQPSHFGNRADYSDKDELGQLKGLALLAFYRDEPEVADFETKHVVDGKAQVRSIIYE